jgi:hypothetical protein
MSSKRGSTTPLSQKQTILSAIRVSTAEYGSALSIVYGQQRVAAKLLDYTDFVAIPHYSQTSSGGKGGGGNQNSNTPTYTYTAAVIAGLCAGQIGSLKSVWDTTGQLVMLSNSESYIIPVGGGTYTPTPPYGGQLHIDEGVTYTRQYSVQANDYGSDGAKMLTGNDDVPMTLGTSGGQYQYSSGTYTFHAADAGNEVTINYIFQIPNSSGDTSQPAEQLSLTLFEGSRPQEPWGYMVGRHPERALAYSGTAYVCSAAMDLGSSGTLPNYNYEIVGLYQFGGGILDANPADIITDVITNSNHGTTFPAANLGDLSWYSNYCVASGIFLSPVLDTQTAAGDTLQQIMTLTNSECVWSEGLLKIVPRGDVTLVGNGATYAPFDAPIYDLDDADFICDPNTEPVTLSIVAPEEQYNQCTLEVLDRGNAYNPVPVYASDFAAIQVNGLRPADTFTAHEICDPQIGNMVAQLINRRTCYITRTFTFTLGLKYILLEPMDLVTLTCAAMGLNKYPVKLLTIEEDENGLLACTAEEFPWGTATHTLYPNQSPAGYAPNTAVDGGNINAPIIFEASNRLTEYSGYELWMGISSSNPAWGGADIWASTDNATYKRVGVINSPSRMGFLTAAFLGGSGGTNVASPTACSQQVCGSNASSASAWSLPSTLFTGGNPSWTSNWASTLFHTYTLIMNDCGLSIAPSANIYSIDVTVDYTISPTSTDGADSCQLWLGLYNGQQVGNYLYFGNWANGNNVGIVSGGSGASVSVSGSQTLTLINGVDINLTYADINNTNFGCWFAWADGAGTYPFLDRSCTVTGCTIKVNQSGGASSTTLSVDLTESFGMLQGGTAADSDNFNTLCWVDGELVSYETATLTGAYQYDLSGEMNRGVYGTPISDHPIGAPFLRLDESVFIYDFDPTWAGTDIWLKFTSFNYFGQSEQSLAAVTAYPFHVPGLAIGAINKATGLLQPASHQTLDFIRDGVARHL